LEYFMDELWPPTDIRHEFMAEQEHPAHENSSGSKVAVSCEKS
jgi:hypothetical protein